MLVTLPSLSAGAVPAEHVAVSARRLITGYMQPECTAAGAKRDVIVQGATAARCARPFQAGRNLLSALAACLALSHCAPIAQAQSAPVFPIGAVIAEVKRELAAAQNAAGAAVDLKLQKVEATLAVSRIVDANGKVSVGVPALGVELGGSGSRKAEDSSTLYVELVPPEPGRALGVTETRNFGLTEAIVDTRRELAKGLRDEPKLDPKKVVITVKFGVTQGVGPTGQLKLVVLTVGGGVSVASSDVSTIVLTFAANPARAPAAPQK